MPRIPELKKKMDSALSSGTYYPYLFVIFFIFYNLREIHYCVAPGELWLPVLLLVGAVFFVLLLVKLILKSSLKAAILTLLLFAFILLYNDIYFQFNSATETVVRNRFIILVMSAVLCGTGTLLFFLKRPLEKLTHYLNMVFFLICIYEIALLVNSGIRGEQWSDYMSTADKMFTAPPPPPKESPLPDIYLIITDAYTSSASLKTYMGYDNRPFTDSLAAMGFYTAAHASSNYASTHYSIASLLNADYLAGFETKMNDPVMKGIILMTLINNNTLLKKLSGHGYVTRNLSLFRLNGIDKFYTYDCLALPDFTLLKDKLLSKTIFLWLKIYDNMMYRPELIRELTDSTLAISKIKKGNPQFVYTHFPVPHSPFYFESSGRVRETPASPDDIPAYVEQLKHVNRIILRLTGEIQKNTDKKSIILIMGDHGSRMCKSDTAEEENFTTLSSFYFPGEDYSVLNDSIRHVNVFRAVLNKYLGERMPYLDDHKNKPLPPY